MIRTAILLAAIMFNTPCFAQLLENFDEFGPDGTVLFRADTWYSADGFPDGVTGGSPTGSSMGDPPIRNGNIVADTDILQLQSGFGRISEDQGGTGNFLYNGTFDASRDDYTGLVWGSQIILVTPNTDYRLTFYLTNSGGNTPAVIKPSINGIALPGEALALGAYTDDNQNHQWQQFEFGWNSGASTTAAINLRNLTASGDGNDFGLDTISLTAVESIGDFDVDGDVDGDDVNFYIGSLNQAATGDIAQLDLNGDGEVTVADHNLHVTTLVVTSNGVAGALLGDVNLDGMVDVLTDAFALVGSLGQSATSRSQGDLNADGVVDVLNDAFLLVGQLGLTNEP